MLVGKSCSAPFPLLLVDQSLLSTLESAGEPILLLSTAVALLLLSVVHAVDAADCQLIMQLALLLVQLLTQMMLPPVQLLLQMMLLPVQLLMQMMLLVSVVDADDAAANNPNQIVGGANPVAPASCFSGLRRNCCFSC